MSPGEILHTAVQGIRYIQVDWPTRRGQGVDFFSVVLFISYFDNYGDNLSDITTILALAASNGKTLGKIIRLDI